MAVCLIHKERIIFMMKEGDLSTCCQAVIRLLQDENQEWQNDEEEILICSECGAESEEK